MWEPSSLSSLEAESEREVEDMAEEGAHGMSMHEDSDGGTGGTATCERTQAENDSNESEDDGRTARLRQLQEELAMAETERRAAESYRGEMEEAFLAAREKASYQHKMKAQKEKDRLEKILEDEKTRYEQEKNEGLTRARVAVAEIRHLELRLKTLEEMNEAKEKHARDGHSRLSQLKRTLAEVQERKAKLAGEVRAQEMAIEQARAERRAEYTLQKRQLKDVDKKLAAGMHAEVELKLRVQRSEKNAEEEGERLRAETLRLRTSQEQFELTRADREVADALEKELQHQRQIALKAAGYEEALAEETASHFDYARRFLMLSLLSLGGLALLDAGYHYAWSTWYA
mmetsp:Transcript_1591/g.3469  ORF Transcript_1591/g.3469 Transcript_1591/m.3469 type:complete len:344 (+) Transcript_1591:86-1117(+)